MPAISRPLLVVLALAIVALVAFYGTQGSRDAAGDGDTPVAQAPQPAADSAGQPSGGDRPASGPARAAERALADAGAPAADADAVPVARGEIATVRRALARGEVVVLFFGSPAGADDNATARAVAAQDGVAKVTVVREPVGRLAAYQQLVGALGITQAPAVVVVGKRRGATLLEGYVDGATLRQEISDAR